MFHQVTDLFKTYLMPGERVLWTGQPKQGLVLTGADVFLIPFSLLWGGFAIFWNAGVWGIPDSTEQVDWLFRLWGLPFLVLGLYFIFGRFLHDARVRKHMYYAVTDQRILILRSSRSPKLTSLDLHRLPRLELTEKSNGTGTIVFDGDRSLFSMNRLGGFDSWAPSLSGVSQFLLIPDPRKVYGLIRDQSRN